MIAFAGFAGTTRNGGISLRFGKSCYLAFISSKALLFQQESKRKNSIHCKKTTLT